MSDTFTPIWTLTRGHSVFSAFHINCSGLHIAQISGRGALQVALAAMSKLDPLFNEEKWREENA